MYSLADLMHYWAGTYSWTISPQNIIPSSFMFLLYVLHCNPIPRLLLSFCCTRDEKLVRSLGTGLLHWRNTFYGQCTNSALKSTHIYYTTCRKISSNCWYWFQVQDNCCKWGESGATDLGHGREGAIQNHKITVRWICLRSCMLYCCGYNVCSGVI